MSDEALKKLEEIHNEVKEIKESLGKRDVVDNETYCKIRSDRGVMFKKRTLLAWFEKGCPRFDSRHVSISAVDKWAEEKNTRQPKK